MRPTGMTERRKAKRKDWVVGTDDVGRPMLQWKVDRRDTSRRHPDPLADTYSFLERLDVPELTLADDEVDEGCNPYNHETSSFKALKRNREKER